jgi:hypothetical protein
MTGRVVILGASLGALVAAAELRSRGLAVTVIEKSHSVGGLYNKVETPFGIQELGMHVVYADHRHFRHLCAVFGEEVFNVMEGPRVDIGGSANFGTVSFDSHYPNLLAHPRRREIIAEMKVAARAEGGSAANAEVATVDRFGRTAAREIVLPILEKLWDSTARELTPHALHCFFDLRRLVVCPEEEANRLKDGPALDRIIANPVQTRPKGEVFGGRMGLSFRTGSDDLNERVIEWSKSAGVTLRLGATVELGEDGILIDGKSLSDGFDACLVSTPVHSLVPGDGGHTDRRELSVYYFQLEQATARRFPSYYVLAHDTAFRASRIVNYDGYNQKNADGIPSVIAVESVHPVSKAPAIDQISSELEIMFPWIGIADGYALARRVGVFAPTLANARVLDGIEDRVRRPFGDRPVFFTGMRTDTGIFFSHHTIGLAYECALACSRRLS